jgi:hypothetical protein
MASREKRSRQPTSFFAHESSSAAIRSNVTRGDSPPRKRRPRVSYAEMDGSDDDLKDWSVQKKKTVDEAVACGDACTTCRRYFSPFKMRQLTSEHFCLKPKRARARLP